MRRVAAVPATRRCILKDRWRVLPSDSQLFMLFSHGELVRRWGGLVKAESETLQVASPLKAVPRRENIFRKCWPIIAPKFTGDGVRQLFVSIWIG